MYIPRLRRVRLLYSQLEIANQIKAISDLVDLRNEATPKEAEQYDSAIEVSQFTLEHMLSKNKKILKREV